MNRDESLAYWYLRLNGFFLVPHFVVHTDPPSQIDFLALRPPGVYEEVGGQPEDWHAELLGNNVARFICVLCEVKGGRRYDATTVFRPTEVEYALPRFGILTPEERANAIAELQTSPISNPRTDVQVRKLLVAHRRMNGVAACDFVSLETTWSFIRERLDRYRNAKGRARALFDADRIDEVLADIERARAWNCDGGEVGG